MVNSPVTAGSGLTLSWDSRWQGCGNELGSHQWGQSKEDSFESGADITNLTLPLSDEVGEHALRFSLMRVGEQTNRREMLGTAGLGQTVSSAGTACFEGPEGTPGSQVPREVRGGTNKSALQSVAGVRPGGVTYRRVETVSAAAGAERRRGEKERRNSVQRSERPGKDWPRRSRGGRLGPRGQRRYNQRRGNHRTFSNKLRSLQNERKHGIKEMRLPRRWGNKSVPQNDF